MELHPKNFVKIYIPPDISIQYKLPTPHLPTVFILFFVLRYEKFIYIATLLRHRQNGASTPATFEIGIVCSQICPGPLMTVLNTPSPPNSIFFTPGTL